jgi:hypothetical protein
MRRLALLPLALALAGCPEQVPPSDPPAEKPAEKPTEKKPPDAKDGDQGHQLVDVKAGSPYRDVEARALQLFALGRLDEAITLVTPFGADKENSGAQRILAMVYLRKGDGEKAKPHVENYKAHPAAQKGVVEVFDKRMAQLTAGGTGTFNHDPLGSILEEAVQDRSVDYTKVEARQADLENYLKAVSTADAGALSADERSAFYANAYNAWVLHAVLKSKLNAGNKGVQDVQGFFDKQQYPVAGEQLTLNALEEKMLRPPHGPAEVHFVVNCASVSCPPLRAKPYTGADWKKSLDEQTKAYLKHDVTLDKAKKTISVVKLFEWYEKDFGGKDGVRAFLAKHGVKEASDPAWTVTTKPYDWRLNKVR